MLAHMCSVRFVQENQRVLFYYERSITTDIFGLSCTWHTFFLRQTNWVTLFLSCIWYIFFVANQLLLLFCCVCRPESNIFARVLALWKMVRVSVVDTPKLSARIAAFRGSSRVQIWDVALLRTDNMKGGGLGLVQVCVGEALFG